MNKKTVLNKLLNILLVLIITGIAALVAFRFVLPKKNGPPPGNFRVTELENIVVTDLSGNKMKLGAVMPGDSSFYLLICDMDDCFSCIFKGVDDMSKLHGAGHENAVIVVADKIEDVNGWTAANFPDYRAFYMLDTAGFYRHIHTPVTPVLAKIEKGKIISFRFIEP